MDEQDIQPAEYWIVSLRDGSVHYLSSAETVGVFMWGRRVDEYTLYKRVPWPMPPAVHKLIEVAEEA